MDNRAADPVDSFKGGPYERNESQRAYGKSGECELDNSEQHSVASSANISATHQQKRGSSAFSNFSKHIRSSLNSIFGKSSKI